MLDKIIKILGWVVIGVSALIGVLFFFTDGKTLETKLAATQDLPAEMKILEIDKIAGEWGGLVLNFSIYLFIACAVIAIGFAIYKFVADAIDKPKSAIKPALALVGVAILVLISYSLASDAIPVFLGSDNFDITPATSKWVETSLYGMYILFAITVLALVYTELSRIWR
ncbi:MAG: hypothetical protein PHW83_06205 [Bacteroidales bacterium]|nr:hypothetical protein [Bacteroidales bacterium]